MKINHLLLAICFFFAAVAAQAQPQRGSVLIGGGAGFQSVNSEFFDYTVFSLSPLAGFFVTNQFAVGAQVTLSFIGSDGDNFSTVGLSPFLRYYFNQSGSTRFFGQGALTYQSTKFEGEDSESAFGFGLGAGLDYFFNQHVALEAILGYNSLKGENDDSAVGTFGVTIGVAAFIGGGGGDRR